MNSVVAVKMAYCIYQSRVGLVIYQTFTSRVLN